MLQFSPTSDLDAIRQVLVQPRAWSYITNDSAPAREAFQVQPCDSIRYVLVRDGDKALGMFLLSGGEIEPEVHFCFRPVVRIGTQVLRWIWSHTILQKLIGPVPSYNLAALRLVHRLGFKDMVTVPSGQTRQGQPFDLIYTYLLRP